MSPSVNITICMPTEMLAAVDAHADELGLSRAAYLRHCIRQAEDSPFDPPESTR